MEREESKNKAGAEKQEFVGVSGLALDFLLSSKLLVIGSRALHHESGCSRCVRSAMAALMSVFIINSHQLCQKNPEPRKNRIITSVRQRPTECSETKRSLKAK